MKTKDILISLAIISAAALIVWMYLLGKGYVRLDAGSAGAELQVQNGWFAGETISSATGTVQVNTRVLHPRRLSVSQRQNGQTWRIESLGPWGELSRIKIRPNETAALRLGPPFLVKPRVSRSGSVVSVDYTIIGQAGEHYRTSAMRDGRTVTGAQINIVDEAGNVLNTGTFKYG